MPAAPSRLRLLPAAAAGLAAAALAACGPEPTIGPRGAGGASTTAGTFSDVSARILVPRCATAGCHGGQPPAFSPSYDAATSYQANVGVPSQQLPSMKLVEPGDPAGSYLVQKTRGTQALVGGGGARMPVASSPLDDADQAALEAWIANGAPHD
ncbi:MAG TPA: hypothetical protein VML50_03510 [Anaeromyxobacter sp.]|nr:hypothetical protein [Anaeromyxobacter sp.]